MIDAYVRVALDEHLSGKRGGNRPLTSKAKDWKAANFRKLQTTPFKWHFYNLDRQGEWYYTKYLEGLTQMEWDSPYASRTADGDVYVPGGGPWYASPRYAMHAKMTKGNLGAHEIEHLDNMRASRQVNLLLNRHKYGLPLTSRLLDTVRTLYENQVMDEYLGDWVAGEEPMMTDFGVD